MKLLFLVLLFSLSLALSIHTPRPLILQLKPHSSDIDEETQLRCSSWRLSVEANNASPWRTVPIECGEYVKDYMLGKNYRYDLEMVASEELEYLKSVDLGGDGKDAWVFDIDETLLSNLPYYVDHGFGLEIFNSQEFDEWVAKAMAPAIESSLKIYNEVLEMGIKIILLTGRAEVQRKLTIHNLNAVGFHDWDELILRGLNDHSKTALAYKSEKRSEMIAYGYRIIGNSGDQWSDLLGSSLCKRSFKLPNPMYFIS